MEIEATDVTNGRPGPFPWRMKVNVKVAAWSLAAVVTLACSSAQGVRPAAGGVYRSFESGAKSVDRGTIGGTVEAVDYSAGWIDLKTSRGIERIAVLPSTIVYVGDRYGTCGDVRKSAKATIDLSEIGGRLVAQIIHIK